jgi:hypothetical protein
MAQQLVKSVPQDTIQIDQLVTVKDSIPTGVTFIVETERSLYRAFAREINHPLGKEYRWHFVRMLHSEREPSIPTADPSCELQCAGPRLRDKLQSLLDSDYKVHVVYGEDDVQHIVRNFLKGCHNADA